MTSIETIKELYTLQSDLLQSAAQTADFTRDDTLLRSVARWAAKICGENEDDGAVGQQGTGGAFGSQCERNHIEELR